MMTETRGAVSSPRSGQLSWSGLIRPMLAPLSFRKARRLLRLALSRDPHQKGANFPCFAINLKRSRLDDRSGDGPHPCSLLGRLRERHDGFPDSLGRWVVDQQAAL